MAGFGKHNINSLLVGSKVTLTGNEGTAVASRALIVGASKEIDTLDITSPKFGGTAISATAAEIDRAADISTRVVTTTATVLALTVTEHAERIVLVNSNSTVANTLTLPVGAGTGAKITIVNNIAQTQGTVVVAANGTDVISGNAYNFGTTEETAQAFRTSATSDKISLNLTTTGGGVGGDTIVATDVAANTWSVDVHVMGSGALATPFSAT